MKMAKIITTLLMMTFWVLQPSWAQDRLGGPNPCREHPQVNGPCFKVHGRIRVYNGNPSVRIWPVGTNRLLGVSEGRFYNPEYANMPPDLSRLLTGDNEIFADFEICPFTPDEPDVMRLVCIDSASNVVVRKIPTE
jgi:hypothetical protein